MITSKITSKAQTTIPQAIRTELQLREGDEIAYFIEAGKVTIRKAPMVAPAADDPFGVFTEWDSDADRNAYGNL
jgi:antitoxin PrlF